MPTEPIGLRVLADFASDALHFELLKPANVVAWADSLIAEVETPPAWLIELSLSRVSDPLSIHAALREVPGESALEESLRLLNALVWREWSRGVLTIGKVRGVGWELYRSEFEQHDLSKWGVVVECEGEALDDGHINEATMHDIIDRELARFADDVRLLPSWA